MNKRIQPSITMTKSYLMENQQSTTPTAATTTTKAATAANSTSKCLKKTTKSLASFTGNGIGVGDTNQHRFNINNNNHHNQQKHQVMDHDSPEWLNGVCHVENHGMSSMLTNIGIGNVGDDEPALLTTATNKNIMNTMPSMAAYMNGNGVRTGRRRHFSQQQTGIHTENDDDDAGGGGDENNHNNDNNSNNDENNRSKGDQQQQLTTNNNNNKRNSNNENGINHSNNNNKNHNNNQNANNNNNKMETEIIQATKASSAINETKIFDKLQHSASINMTNNNIQPQHQQQQPEQFVSADYSNNELNMYDSYDNGQKQWIDRLAKGIGKVLRVAKESRRLKCTELLVPRMLTTNIAEDVIEMAECEPCGLRGCLLLIFIENNDNQQQQQRQKSTSTTNGKNNTAVTLANRNGNSSPSPPPPPSGTLSASRLLGEFAIDNNVVPTFEVFLTLKRVEPSWLESLENRFFNKTPIILSEVYLLNKKKLYQPSSPIL